MQEELLIAGTGGQGVDSAGSVLAHMALEQDLEVCYISLYSPEVRGGWVTSTVVIADAEVGSPIVGKVDSLLLFDKRAADDHLAKIRAGGLVVANSSLTGPLTVADAELIELPATKMAAELGNEQATNMIMLGAYVEVRGLLQLSYFEAALKTVLPDRHHKHIPLNLEAAKLGAQQVS